MYTVENMLERSILVNKSVEDLLEDYNIKSKFTIITDEDLSMFNIYLYLDIPKEFKNVYEEIKEKCFEFIKDTDYNFGLVIINNSFSDITSKICENFKTKSNTKIMNVYIYYKDDKVQIDYESSRSNRSELMDKLNEIIYSVHNYNENGLPKMIKDINTIKEFYTTNYPSKFRHIVRVCNGSIFYVLNGDYNFDEIQEIKTDIPVKLEYYSPLYRFKKKSICTTNTINSKPLSDYFECNNFYIDVTDSGYYFGLFSKYDRNNNILVIRDTNGNIVALFDLNGRFLEDSEVFIKLTLDRLYDFLKETSIYR